MFVSTRCVNELLTLNKERNKITMTHTTINTTRKITNAIEFDIEAQTGPFGERTITVHDGEFHADDVLACALYAGIVTLPKVNFIRTRNTSLFGGVPVDVGEGQFDHHGTRHEMDSDGVPYCGASRVWEALKTAFGGIGPAGKAWFKQKVIDPVAKLDNGVKLNEGEYNLFSFVHAFNPSFEESPEIADKQFRLAVETAIPIVKRYLKAAQAQDAIQEKLDYYAKNTQHVVVVDDRIPWVKVLPATPAKFVVFFDGIGTYYVQCVPESSEDPFSKKQELPESWAGKRDEEFCKLTDTTDGIFCHVGRFICGFKSFQSATRIASELSQGMYNQ